MQRSTDSISIFAHVHNRCVIRRFLINRAYYSVLFLTGTLIISKLLGKMRVGVKVFSGHVSNRIFYNQNKGFGDVKEKLDNIL